MTTYTARNKHITKPKHWSVETLEGVIILMITKEGPQIEDI
jgi:hypothetical protein